MLRLSLGILVLLCLLMNPCIADWAPLNSPINTPSYGTAKSMAVMTWGESPQYIFTADYNKGVCYSSDGGSHWSWGQDLTQSTKTTLIVVDPYRQDVVYIAREESGNSGFWRSSDDAHTFASSNSGLPTTALTSIQSIYIDPNSPHPIYLTCRHASNDDEERIFESTDDGGSWSRVFGNYPYYGNDPVLLVTVQLDITSMYIEPGENSNNIWVGSIEPDYGYNEDTSGVWFSSDGGDNWTQQLGGPAYAQPWFGGIFYTVHGCIKIIGNPDDAAAPYVYASTRHYWDSMYPFHPANQNIALFERTSDEYPNYSTVWELQGDGTLTDWHDFTGLELIKADDQIFYSVLGLTRTWHSQGLDLNIKAGILKFDMYNPDWETNYNSGLYFPWIDCLALDPSDYNKMYCGTDNYPMANSSSRTRGAVYKTTDWGDQWTEVTRGMHTCASLDLDRNSSYFWAGGYQPDQEYSPDMLAVEQSDHTWNCRFLKGLSNSFRDIATSNSGQYVAVATDLSGAWNGEDSIWVSTDYGETFLPEFAYYRNINTVGHCFAIAGFGNTFFATFDKGWTDDWHVIRRHELLDWEPVCNDLSWPYQAGNEAMAVAASSGSNTVYAGSASLGIYKSDVDPDYAHWNYAGLNGGGFEVDDISVIQIFSSSGTDSLLVKGEVSGQPRVLESTDGGSSWDYSDNGLDNKDLRGMAKYPNSKSVIAATAMGSSDDPHVYVTLNGGIDWMEYSIGIDPQVVHDIKDIVYGDATPTSPGRAVYVGTDNGIYQWNSILPNENIQSDTTWTDDDPILIAQDITIQSGATLTIEPGTQIYFAPSYDDGHSGTDQNRCEFIVNGTLTANAGGGDAITFKPWTNDPAADTAEWYGIVCGSGSSVTLKNCTIERAIYGLKANNTTLNIRHNSFNYIANSGVYSNSSANYAVIDTNAFERCYNRGIDVVGGIGHDFIGNSMDDCKNGLRYSTSTASGTALDVKYNTIGNDLFNGSIEGIHLDASSSLVANLMNNTVNGYGTGIYLSRVTSGTITSNYSHGNSNYGIYLINVTASFSCSNNTHNAFNSNSDGISCNGSTSSTFRYNRAASNSHYGVYVASSSTPNFGTQANSGNNSFSNTGSSYDFYRDGVLAPTVMAENNYWGGGAATKFGNVDCDPYLKNDPVTGTPKRDPGEFPILPEAAMMAKNYPNPFNPQTQIAFSLGQGQSVRVEVFNLLGQKVRSLANGYFNVGDNTIIWDGNNDQGQPQASGIYFCKFTGDITTGSIKMSLLR